ncbi:hypothetical protein B9Y76_19855 [Stenotrophomonas maltophilia]|uniref:hypothetical protein n=1 Tax=Stenotrophomonas TaxID=40323 RepID=UPI000474A139|nr:MULTISPECIES: hypothetical protein [Stenotrophomonas]MBA0415366.1 hypothetical protein [Stenotrophomonas maltophilia]MBA0421547.1 hypothetical protein [Stenotrophomonas maltophilia]MBD3739932.1 hypothetical protein [Stenotrophomonas sp.]MBH1748755.1 hypothetical protein [Stenotrophomonas maltophilia]MBW8372395.1 hypothetical protein [Stenotrophomonas sp.]
MKAHTAVVAGLLLSMSFFTTASAHDPALHANPAPTAAPKAKPTTCEQLADRSKFKVDLNDAQTKALKERCEAQAASKKK